MSLWLSPMPEDDIFYCDKCEFCVNFEIAKVRLGETCLSAVVAFYIKLKPLRLVTSLTLSQKYGKDFGLTFTDNKTKGNTHYGLLWYRRHKTYWGNSRKISR